MGSDLSPQFVLALVVRSGSTEPRTYSFHALLQRTDCILESWRLVYVDNRMLVDRASTGNTKALRHLWHLKFYTEPPILLEEVEGYDALGFNVNPLQRAVSYQLPWDKIIRTHTGIGPSRSVTSGLLARMRLIVQHSQPAHVCWAQLQDIFALHLHVDPEYFRCIDEALQLCRIRFPHMTKNQLLQYA